MGSLFILHLLCQNSVVFLETVTDALLSGHPLEHTAVEAAAFAGGDGL